MDKDKVCYFFSTGGLCRIIAGTTCDGQERCGFYKTEKQFRDESDRAVDICRAKGLCAKCKYHESPCRKYGEGF